MADPVKPLSQSFELPPPKIANCDDLFRVQGDVALNSLGLPYRRIGGGAYPPFFSQPEVERLQREWSSRSDDVFLVFPVEPLSDGFQAFSVALVEQCDIGAVDLDFPRWLDAAVSRRGWKYVDGLENYSERRCLSTRSPPWRFPSKSFQFSCCGNGQLNATETEMPLIAVFVADPRYMVMRELENAVHLAIKAHGEQAPGIDLMDLLNATVRNDRQDAGGLHMLGNSLCATAAWARAEAMYPDRIRIFFTEDFLMQPEVAMRGLARFLQVPEYTSATDNAVQQASRLAGIKQWNPCTLHPQKEYNALRSATVEEVVLEFERRLGMLPQDLQAGWSQLVESWLTSPNSRMVSYALSVLNHDRWNPPSWWVAHNARVCRPCLYFPRGKCDSDSCGFCHGSGHVKPKRPSKGKRAARRRVDRTPSPDAQPIENVHLQAPITGYSQIPLQPYQPYPVQFKSNEFYGDNSGQIRIDRTPSPQRFWARY